MRRCRIYALAEGHLQAAGSQADRVCSLWVHLRLHQLFLQQHCLMWSASAGELHRAYKMSSYLDKTDWPRPSVVILPSASGQVL